MTGMLVVRLKGGARDGTEVQCFSARVDELRSRPGRDFDDVEIVDTVGRIRGMGRPVPVVVELDIPEPEQGQGQALERS